MHKELRTLVEAARNGDKFAIETASELGLALLKGGLDDPETVRDASMAIAISGLNGSLCENQGTKSLYRDCLTDKVIRSWKERGFVSNSVAHTAMFHTADESLCDFRDCANHPHHVVEPITDPFAGYNEPDEYRRKTLDL